MHLWFSAHRIHHYFLEIWLTQTFVRLNRRLLSRGKSSELILRVTKCSFGVVRSSSFARASELKRRRCEFGKSRYYSRVIKLSNAIIKCSHINVLKYNLFITLLYSILLLIFSLCYFFLQIHKLFCLNLETKSGLLSAWIMSRCSFRLCASNDLRRKERRCVLCSRREKFPFAREVRNLKRRRASSQDELLGKLSVMQMRTQCAFIIEFDERGIVVWRRGY